MIVERVYLRLNNTGINVPPISPAYDSSWEVTSSAVRANLLGTKVGSSDTSVASQTAAETSATAVDVLIRQHIGSNDRLAQIYSGTVKGVIAGAEGSADTDATIRFRIAIVSSDGATVRGVLYEGIINAAEMYHITQRTIDLIETPVTTVVAQAGDRLLIESGYRAANVIATSRNANLQYGAAPLIADHVQGSASVADLCPWIEFEWDEYPDPPTNFIQTAATDATIDTSWDAPVAGEAPTSYGVRVDGGAETDVGLVLTHQFTGLTKRTAYTLEVRSKASGFNSAWVPLAASTVAPLLKCADGTPLQRKRAGIWETLDLL